MIRKHEHDTTHGVPHQPAKQILVGNTKHVTMYVSLVMTWVCPEVTKLCSEVVWFYLDMTSLLFWNEWVLFRNELGRFASNLEMTCGCLEVSRLYSKNGLLLFGNYTMPFRYKLVRSRIGSWLSDLVFDCRFLVLDLWILVLVFDVRYFVFLISEFRFSDFWLFPIFDLLSFGFRLLDCCFLGFRIFVFNF